MSKVLKTAGAVVGIAALALTGVGAFLAPAALAGLTGALGGITAGILTVGAGILTLGAGLLAPKPRVSAETTNRLHASFDPSTPRKIVFGHCAMATDIDYAEKGR